MGDEKSQQFLVHHGGGLTLEHLHSHGGFEITETEFQIPSAQIEFGNVKGRINDGIEQGRRDSDLFGAESFGAHLDADDADCDGFRKQSQLLLGHGFQSGSFGPRPRDEPIVWSNCSRLAKVDHTGLVKPAHQVDAVRADRGQPSKDKSMCNVRISV